VRFFSTDRGEWEEIPVDLIDLDKTQKEIKASEEARHEEAATIAAEEKAERDMRHEVERVPIAPGVYMIEDDKLVAIKAGESKVVTNKRRRLLKAISPVPLVPGKATVELDGVHAPAGTSNREPEFYIRLSDEERFAIIRLAVHKGTRLVGKRHYRSGGQRECRRAGYRRNVSPASGRYGLQDLAVEAAGARRIRSGGVHRRQNEYAGLGLFRRARDR